MQNSRSKENLWLGKLANTNTSKRQSIGGSTGTSKRRSAIPLAPVPLNLDLNKRDAQAPNTHNDELRVSYPQMRDEVSPLCQTVASEAKAQLPLAKHVSPRSVESATEGRKAASSQRE